MKRNNSAIYKFSHNVEVGEKVAERPSMLSYINPIITDEFYLHMRIVNQDDKLINFKGEQINLTLAFQLL